MAANSVSTAMRGLDHRSARETVAGSVESLHALAERHRGDDERGRSAWLRGSDRTAGARNFGTGDDADEHQLAEARGTATNTRFGSGIIDRYPTNDRLQGAA